MRREKKHDRRRDFLHRASDSSDVVQSWQATLASARFYPSFKICWDRSNAERKYIDFTLSSTIACRYIEFKGLEAEHSPMRAAK